MRTMNEKPCSGGFHNAGEIRHMSVTGTFETSRDVRSSVAIRGKADVTRTFPFGSD